MNPEATLNGPQADARQPDTQQPGAQQPDTQRSDTPRADAAPPGAERSNASVPPELSPARLNRAFVYSGVARFARLHLQQPSPLVEQLEVDGDLAALCGFGGGEWDAALAHLARLAPSLPGPCGQLLRDYRLQLHEWFVLALCGELEASYLLDLVLMELQGSGTAQPGLHLLEAMADTLFGAQLPPLALPGHRLVRAGVLEIGGEGPLPTRQLAMPARLWAQLCGDSTPWAGTRPLLPGRAVLAAELEGELRLLAQQVRQGQARVLLLRGNPAAGLAAAAALGAELGLLAIDVEAEVWNDRSALAIACHYGSWLPVLMLDLGPGERYRPNPEHVRQTPLVLICGHNGSVDAGDVLEITLPPLSRDERVDAWRAELDGQIPEALAEQALVDGPTIQALAERVRLHSARAGERPGAQHLRLARAQFGSEKLRLLAQPVPHHVEADGLILEAGIQAQFDELALRCQRRESLWQGLGASLADPTPGVRALFVGESGAGKTLAASRLATLLGAPLFRVDLAAVMNKYIGESEKNLSRVLDEAAALDAILLVDEADSLFGRRGEGKETGERYANMLTNFLLTRIENHRGIVVLTSNSRSRIDAAFSRRFDAIIEFPLPAAEERYRLWRSHLGSRAPDMQLCRLLASYSDLPGGHIRNVVLNAAALSPEPESTLTIASLLESLRAEYRKLGRTMPAQLDHIAR